MYTKNNRYAAYRKRTELDSKPAFGQVTVNARFRYFHQYFQLINAFGGLEDY